MRYEGTVFRPPSEAGSLIIQVTIGCAHNKCTFCGMYKDKQFRVRKQEEIFKDLDELSLRYGDYPLRVFLADGDALVLKNERLTGILDHIKLRFPAAERITAYARADDVLRKSAEELAELKERGLEMVYMGAESGSDEILAKVNKGETTQSMTQAAALLKQSGIALSVTFISGLGGKELLKEHAAECARLTGEMNPEYVSFLTLMTDPKAPIINEIRNGSMTLLTPDEVVEEMRIYLENVDSEGTVFRSNHASNYFNLRGTLNRDRLEMLRYLDEVRKERAYRPEHFRGL